MIITKYVINSYIHFIQESEIQELMTKIKDMKVEKREHNTTLKLKKKSNLQSEMESTPSTPKAHSVANRDTAQSKTNSNARMTPKIPPLSKEVICTVKMALLLHTHHVLCSTISKI